MNAMERGALEGALTSALSVTPGASDLARLDERMRRALVAPPARRGWRTRLLPGSRPRLALVVLLIVLITAAAGGTALIERVFSNYPGWQRAWDRAETIGLRQTVGGRTVVVERAYLDANQVLIGVSAEGASDLTAAIRVDGRVPEGMLATGAERPRTDTAAQLFNVITPPGTGERAHIDLVIRTIPELEEVTGAIGGPWHFEFDLRSDGGTAWRGSETRTVSGVTMTLDELVVSPTTVQAHLVFDGPKLDATDDSWIPTGKIIRGEKRTPFNIGKDLRLLGGRTGGPQEQLLFTMDGFDAERGTVTVRIDRITASANNGKQEMLTIEGPWVFEVPLDE
jgi:hypothetical protein